MGTATEHDENREVQVTGSRNFRTPCPPPPPPKLTISLSKVAPSSTPYLTIILRNRAEYHLILSRRGRRPSWLNQGIFRKIEQDNCFIIQQIPIAYHFQNEKNYGSMIKTLKASNT